MRRYTERDMKLPKWLREDTEPLVCDVCGRESWATQRFNLPCGMIQPNGDKCTGFLRITNHSSGAHKDPAEFGRYAFGQKGEYNGL